MINEIYKILSVQKVLISSAIFTQKEMDQTVYIQIIKTLEINLEYP